MSESLTLEEYERIVPNTKVTSKEKVLQFWTPNHYTQQRAFSLFGPNREASERETVRWISEMEENDVLVDIGANVGMFTIYASSKGIKVIAVEPESGNYAALNRNLKLNGLHSRVRAVSGGISNKTEMTTIFMRDGSIGQSCHAVGEALLPNGKPFDGNSGYQQTTMSYRLDDLLELMGETNPNHIKIDVDGIEHLVVEGMEKTLRATSLKTVLIELDPNHENHQKIFEVMSDNGFQISDRQIDECTLQQGGWAGYCNVIFHRKDCDIVSRLWPTEGDLTDVELDPGFAIDLYGKIKHAVVVEEPTPHFVIENVFSEEVYRNIRKFLPEQKHYVNMDKLGWTSGAHARDAFAYRDDFLTLLSPNKDRLIRELLGNLMDGDLLSLVAHRFGDWIPEITSGAALDGFSIEACLTKDYEGYQIGPHTDAPDRVLTMMYYLPDSDECADSGTGLFLPKDEGFSCRGTKWHEFDAFEEAKRIPYKANTLFAFVKTPTSFHGVSPLGEAGIDRDILHITLHKKDRVQ